MRDRASATRARGTPSGWITRWARSCGWTRWCPASRRSTPTGSATRSAPPRTVPTSAGPVCSGPPTSDRTTSRRSTRASCGRQLRLAVKEGTFLFDPTGFELFGFASDGFPFADTPGLPAGLIDPVAQYDHDEGVATIGGFVYRGSRVPELYGKYVFGDYSDGPSSGNGRVMYVDEADRANPSGVHPRSSTWSTDTSTCSCWASVRTPTGRSTCSPTRPECRSRRTVW